MREEMTDQMTVLCNAVVDIGAEARQKGMRPDEIRLALAHACSLFIFTADEFTEFGDDIKAATMEMDDARDAKARAIFLGSR